MTYICSTATSGNAARLWQPHEDRGGPPRGHSENRWGKKKSRQKRATAAEEGVGDSRGRKE
jgi:hypothetical protein